MKLQHRIPPEAEHSAHVDPTYQAEVDRATERNERRYAQAQARLAKAEARLARARNVKRGSGRQHKRQIAELVELVELRRQELLTIAAAMTSAPAAAQHRGHRTHRHVPAPTVL